jgi:ubiquinone/menaquinone biosynthesis C-methylase UbiE
MTPAMLDRARRLAAERGVRNVDWHQGDIYLLPYAAENFTIVVTRHSFHHLIDPTAALREMARVCAAKGRIVVVDAYAPEDSHQAAEFNRVERLRDPSHVRSLSLSALITSIHHRRKQAMELRAASVVRAILLRRTLSANGSAPRRRESSVEGESTRRESVAMSIPLQV